MRYDNIHEARFLSRPNRFIAHVEVESREEIVHVKNTGRCRELLLPGAKVFLCRASDPRRKTRYDLVAVEKEGRIINIDSQAPNKAAGEYLRSRYPEALLRPEYRHGDSRLDFYMEHPERGPVFIEVKGVTLFVEGEARFPDAPTQRGAKHLRELMDCVKEGHEAWALFVIQAKGIRSFSPNEKTDPAFAKALREAAKAGVRILALDCLVEADRMEIQDPVPVRLF